MHSQSWEERPWRHQLLGRKLEPTKPMMGTSLCYKAWEKSAIFLLATCLSSCDSHTCGRAHVLAHRGSGRKLDLPSSFGLEISHFTASQQALRLGWTWVGHR